MTKHKKKNLISCCKADNSSEQYPDHTKELHRLNRISGQVNGIKGMILNREYCPKIIAQLQAVRGALKSLEAVVLEKHLASCVRDAVMSKDDSEVEKKMEELINLFRSN